MAEESSSVAAFSYPPSTWWDLHPSTSLSSCWQQPPNPHSCHEYDEVSVASSFTNTSSHPILTAESSLDHQDQFMGDAVLDNHIWRHVLSSVGNNGQMHNNQDIGESLVDALSSFNNADHNKHLAGIGESLTEMETLTKLSDSMVANWSIAPPDRLDLCHVQQHSFNSSGLFTNNGLKGENERQETESVPGPFHRTNAVMGYPIGFNTSILGGDSKYHYGMHNSPRNLADAISFSTQLGKPLIDDNICSPKPSLKAPTLSDNVKKRAQQISSPTRTDVGRGNDVNEGKKKKRMSEDNSETALKKTKQESSLTTKVPKVKLADKITALQQVVSPFGKTDTASVLYEAIGYVKFLQEQVQLLANPYMKTNSHKSAWGGRDWKDKGDAKHELGRRGLCLVPVSCTPQVCRENTGSEYWTPTYRGIVCMNRRPRGEVTNQG